MIHVSGKPVMIHVPGKPVMIHISGKPVMIESIRTKCATPSAPHCHNSLISHVLMSEVWHTFSGHFGLFFTPILD